MPDRTASSTASHSRRLLGWWCVVCCLSLPAMAADASEILRVRWYSAPTYTRVVLDLAQPASYAVKALNGPPRLAVNVPSAVLLDAMTVSIEDGLVQRIRCNQNRERAQVVIDLVAMVDYRAFALPAADGRPDRVVLDIQRAAATDVRDPLLPAAPATSGAFRVIIDPGHGGLDPGAIRAGLQEKDIVLDVGLRLSRILTAMPGYEPVLTREVDWYPSLAERVQRAAAAKGNLFVSLHCNTHRDTNMRGMEVYFLSLQGATDREAEELAERENAADLVGLSPSERTSDTVLAILMDLHMTRVLRRSSRLAESLLATATAAELPTRRVKQARFQVLRSLAMPSALVELAYLSNPQDRRLLASDQGRQRLAEMLAAGILAFCDDKSAVLAQAQSAAWSQRYRVQGGDNLWRLAQRHATTVPEIRRHNNLPSDRIQVGQFLSLPGERPLP
ncbi:MAG: N-acetylmuramoyl-L-alanine amidase [Candidatus Krumholzibacteria bacterium]|nr:N-acetylmuramoyl-L-alanine amidase [Candidatus Krumholzibacteria bacterium]